ncbi:MAG: NADH-quinone oxidoreductase subunit NuoF [Actinobacteria bacterium]|nr:NADH-quinone oxidoreductase subunit NuoF [Actinomycetota bacterium]
MSIPGASGARSSGTSWRVVATVGRGPDVGATGVVEALSKRYGLDDGHTLDAYKGSGGYAGLRRALELAPNEIIEIVKDSGLRGRGGAGFPTGMKWGFVAQDTGKPIYVVCNADEGEPGTFKDRELMERDPHALVEGMVVAGLALNSEHGMIYLRGEFAHAGRRLRAAIAEAYEAGYLGDDVLGSGKRHHLTIHRGAGAYICGEETALLDSLEGRRGQPRLRPPFPATHGLYGCPTTVNNVETIASVPLIVLNGADWFRQWGTEKSPGFKLMCIAGEVERPGNYEFALGTPVRQMLEHVGGMKDGREVSFWHPGGSSTPFLTAEHLDLPYAFEEISEAGSLLGTGAISFFSTESCIVDVTLRFTEFYEHESCGKCTPCREGTYWLSQILRRIEVGRGREDDLAVLQDVCDNIFGRSFCALGDGATSPIVSSLKYFADDYELHIAQGRCPKEITPPDRSIPMLEPVGLISPPRPTTSAPPPSRGKA